MSDVYGAPRTVRSRTVYENAWIRVREDEIVRSDGTPGIYGVVEKGDFALIVPVDDEGRFCLVEEFRYPIRRRVWAFPAGSIPGRPDAEPVEIARRELREETGLRAERFERLGYLHNGPATTTQGFTVFLATGLVQGEPEREPEEQDMRHAWFTRDRFRRMIADGAVTDDSTVAAFTLLTLREDPPP